ncbi:hypothetical protein [Sphingobacterium bovistauri]|uniref:PorT family protein n=1 Tax=Sphingobacterium bovistauri TaxID=2781959 RepID=A0ABS7Z387_9SPHI|nr:hypothetical protein [Sphingobacterium bovistauri]MCA5004650.1 hypothetical protein [Sphingobacterium bovistauri]
MKTLFTISILLTSILPSVAQKLNPVVSLQGGITNNFNKTNSPLRSGYNSKLTFYQPFLSIKNTSLGVSASASMSNLSTTFSNADQIVSQYQLRGETYPVNTIMDGNKTKVGVFVAGLESFIAFGKFNLSPAVQIGYLSLNIPSYSIQAVFRDKMQDVKHIDLQQRINSKSKGTVLSPELKIGYKISSRINIYANSSYIVGPQSKIEVRKLIPQGGFNEINTYSTTQLLNGTYESNTQTVKNRLLNFNLGIALNLGKQKSKSTFTKTVMLTSLNQLNTTSKKIKLNENKTKGKFIALEKGIYELSINEPTRLEAQDFNTTRSNRDNRLKIKPDGTSSNDSIPKRQEAQDFNTTRSNRDNRLKIKPDSTSSNDSIPIRQEAQDFNTTRSNRDNRLKTKPDGTSSNDSVPTRQEAQDFNTTRSNRDNRLKINPKDGILVIKNIKESTILKLPINSNRVRFEILEKGKYSLSIE